MTELGKGEYEVFITDRGGIVRVMELPKPIKFSINWIRDDFGECQLTLAHPRGSEIEMLNTVKAVRHEIVIYRNGFRLWEGPITRIGYYGDRIEIDAKDVVWYLSRRALEIGWDFRGERTNTINHVYNVLKHHYPEVDDEYNIGPYLAKANLPGEVGNENGEPWDHQTSSQTFAYEETVYNTLDNFASSGGIDYVVRGRGIHIHDSRAVVQRTTTLTQDDFLGSLAIVEYGSQLNTQVYVTNAKGITSVARAPQQWLDYYGFIDDVITEEREGDENEPTEGEFALDDIAERNLSAGYPTPVVVQVPGGVGVKPEAPVDITELMPGVYIPVQATIAGKTFSQLQKVDELRIQVDATGEYVGVSMTQAPALYANAVVS